MNVVWIATGLHEFKLEQLSTLPARLDSRNVIPIYPSIKTCYVDSGFHGKSSRGFIPVIQNMYLTYADKLVVMSNVGDAKTVGNSFMRLWREVR